MSDLSKEDVRYVGRNLRWKLRNLGWTQQHLTNRLSNRGWKISTATLSRFLSGDHIRMASADLSALAEVLKCDAEELVEPVSDILDRYMEAVADWCQETLASPLLRHGPVPLRDLFVEPNVAIHQPVGANSATEADSLDQLPHLQFASDSLEHVLGALQSELNGLHVIDTRVDTPVGSSPAGREGIPLRSVLAQSRRVLLVGEPGAGKTALVKTLCLSAIDLQTLESDIRMYRAVPILISCRELGPVNSQSRASGSDIISYAVHMPCILKWTQTDRSELDTALHDLVRRRRAFIVVDGIDEVPNIDDRLSLLELINGVSAKNPGVRVLITSRPGGWCDIAPRLEHDYNVGQILRFNEVKKKVFAAQWWQRTGNDQRMEGLERFIQINRSYSGNPLMLTCMAAVFSNNPASPPETEIEVCQRTVELLRVTKSPEQSHNEARRTVAVTLPLVAYKMTEAAAHPEQCVRVSESELREILLEIGSYSCLGIDILSPKELLEQLADDLWLFGCCGQQDGERVFEFLHLTFQHYLAAEAICEGIPGKDGEFMSASSAVQKLIESPKCYNDLHLIESVDTRTMAAYRHRKEVIRYCFGLCRRSEVREIVDATIGEPLWSSLKPAQKRLRSLLMAYAVRERTDIRTSIAKTILNRFVESIAEDDTRFHFQSPSLFVSVAIALASNQQLAPTFLKCLQKSECRYAPSFRAALFSGETALSNVPSA